MNVSLLTATHSLLDAALSGLERSTQQFVSAGQAVLQGAVEDGVAGMKRAEAAMDASVALSEAADEQLQALVDLMLG